MKRNKLYLIAFVGAMSATAFAIPVTSRLRALATPGKGPAAKSFQSASRVRSPNRILISRLSPQLRIPFSALGNRLLKSGMERLIMSGTLSRDGTTQPVKVVHEFPGLLRVTGNQGPIVSYNGRLPGNSQTINPGGRALIETLLYDSVEYFFIAQWQGAATRFLGARASAPEAERSDDASYDVYEVINASTSDWSRQLRVKRYFFNSDTQLLEVVKYEVERDGATVSVETHFGDWHLVQGQQAPGAITRSENGRVVLSFTFASATLAPRNLVDATNPLAGSAD